MAPYGPRRPLVAHATIAEITTSSSTVRAEKSVQTNWKRVFSRRINDEVHATINATHEKYKEATDQHQSFKEFVEGDQVGALNKRAVS